MEKTTDNIVEDLDQEQVVKILREWKMEEFTEFVKEKEVDGRKLMEEVSLRTVKLSCPKSNAEKFVNFVQELKLNPDKYLNRENNVEDSSRKVSVDSLESQYQTVIAKKLREEQPATINTTNNRIEEILKKIVPSKSFLYRNQSRAEKTTNPYLPMEPKPPRKCRRFFRLSSYEYPSFDLRLRFSRSEYFNDRGYYTVKSNNKTNVQMNPNKTESRNYKSLSTLDVSSNKAIVEEHFYEDLNYIDVEKDRSANKNDVSSNNINRNSVKPCMVKIQEIFQSIRFPFFKRNEEFNNKYHTKRNGKSNQEDVHLYENTNVQSNMYDSIHDTTETVPTYIFPQNKQRIVGAEEDYLEPIQVNKDYCDVSSRDRDDSILSYFLSVFESRFGFRRETNETNQSENADQEIPKEACDIQKWNDCHRSRGNMADRPLPVPIENEPYYMDIDRNQAENLLRGQPDGTFILRPSSQPNHIYTLSVACSNAVHNVGVRRRQDGRLALGFARRGERSFVSVSSLLRYHRKRRLLLVAAGGVIGATTLNESPQYYQTPKNIPVSI